MMLDTVAHAMRHAWQLVASEETNPGWWLGQYGADRGTPEEATDWAATFDDFDGEDCWNQVVEVDARRSGPDCITGLTPEEFADLMRAAGRTSRARACPNHRRRTSTRPSRPSRSRATCPSVAAGLLLGGS